MVRARNPLYPRAGADKEASHSLGPTSHYCEGRARNNKIPQKPFRRAARVA